MSCAASSTASRLRSLSLDVAMTVIEPVLKERDEAIEWRDREIARLRGLLDGKSSDESS